MVDHLLYPVDDINLTLRACNPAEPLPPCSSLISICSRLWRSRGP